MNLLYCLTVVVFLCGFCSYHEYDERLWYEKTDSSDQPAVETVTDLSEAFNCTSGQVCKIAVSSIKNAIILPFTVPIRIVTLSGDLELSMYVCIIIVAIFCGTIIFYIRMLQNYNF
uniref:Uncharacterized protein n=1 Tax=Caenorhabditis tropicalis TaxID=1561998 RepID=A0A1I7U1Z1_9PELO